MRYYYVLLLSTYTNQQPLAFSSVLSFSLSPLVLAFPFPCRRLPSFSPAQSGSSNGPPLILALVSFFLFVGGPPT